MSEKSRTKSDAIIKAFSLVGKRPPKSLPNTGEQAEWRENHRRVWVFEGWIDLAADLTLIGTSEDLKEKLR